MNINLPKNATLKQVEKGLKKSLSTGGEYSRETSNGLVCITKGLSTMVKDGILYAYSERTGRYVEC